MPFVRLVVIADCCLIAVCLVVIGLLGLVGWHGQWRIQSGDQGDCEPQGRHRLEEQGAHRVCESVAEIRERERAEGMRYWPKGGGEDE